jgi:histidine triad (HIT) family protein
MAQKKDDCIFCKIADGEIPCMKVYEDAELLAFLDISPASKGHTLVITKEHFDNFLQVPKDLLGRAYSLAQRIGQVQVAVFHAEGVNVITNVGEIAGQSIKHFHIHVIPRYGQDGLALNFKPNQIEKFNLPVLAEQLKKKM